MSPALLLIMLSPLPSPAMPGAAAFPPPTRFLDVNQACPKARVRMAQVPESVRPRRLIDLPPGRLELSVLREVDGCPIPAVLREGVGAAPPMERRPTR